MRMAGCELPHDASTLGLALPRQAPGQATRAPHRSAQATSPPSRTPWQHALAAQACTALAACPYARTSH